MTQLKFDKNGNLNPQKINYEIKHTKDDQEAIKRSELEKELLHALEALELEDRDVKTLAIFCNPNYIKGCDTVVRDQLNLILSKLKKSGLVIKEKSPKKRVIYTLTNQFKNRSKKHSRND